MRVSLTAFIFLLTSEAIAGGTRPSSGTYQANGNSAAQGIGGVSSNIDLSKMTANQREMYAAGWDPTKEYPVQDETGEPSCDKCLPREEVIKLKERMEKEIARTSKNPNRWLGTYILFLIRTKNLLVNLFYFQPGILILSPEVHYWKRLRKYVAV